MGIGRCLFSPYCVFVFVLLNGCASYTDQETLQKKVTDLDGRVKKLETEVSMAQREDANRRQQLENCVTIEADATYWQYVRLNGKMVKEGEYSASQFIWDQARRQKMDKIEECKLLYGH